MIELKAKLRSSEPAPNVAKSSSGAPKIVEVSPTKQKQDLEVSKEEKSSAPKVSGKTKTLNKETVDKAAEIAT